MNNNNKMCAILSSVTKNPNMSPLTDERPVATLPFDCKYRLIDFPLSCLSNAHVNSVFMTFNEGETQSVFDHLGAGSEWGLDGINNRFFIYIYQDFERLREKGLAYFNQQINFLRKANSPYTVLIGSKFICNVDLNAVLKIHKASGKEVTAVYKKVSPDLADDYDTIIRFDEDGKMHDSYKNQIEDLAEKEALNINIFIVNTDWLIDFLHRMQEINQINSIAHLLRAHMNEFDVNGYEYTGYMSNIISIKNFYDANMMMLDTANFTSLLYSSQPVLTKIKNEVPTFFSEESNVVNSQLGSGCVVEGTVKNSLISRASTVEKGAVIENSLLFTDSEVKENSNIKYAIIDKHVVIENGVSVIGTAEKPVVIPKGTIVTEDVIQR
ncbi:glucose-1-phosphate adenylyltransferase subunit GlgD [Lactococcus nasutitermitis]|uniref:Glucose-1-phosphate adenylyltransferase subunit GlgD n=1 Tax=Lactococcus nasutitermitis TaxID=1652957 RepID=A0ABV9JAQ2_9LACT|nr:glucose-1-phosphate adenylyltransferase subunit GlgD [Lactococcus nasutitermitis]